VAKPEDYLGDIVKSLSIQLANALSNVDESKEQIEHLSGKLEEERAMRHKLEEE